MAFIAGALQYGGAEGPDKTASLFWPHPAFYYNRMANAKVEERARPKRRARIAQTVCGSTGKVNI